MRRSEINVLLDEGIAFLNSRGLALPPPAYWSLQDWQENRDNAAELHKRGIGWDLTDFGSKKFGAIGLLCYTLSNGILDSGGQPLDQVYSNKLLIVAEKQITPMHHHRSKIEDIINLGGGNLQIKVFNVSENERLDDESSVEIFRNGMGMTCQPGTTITLQPGERVRLDPVHFHEFWGQPRQGKVLVEEVSSVNDDRTDNIFLGDFGRFPEIIEDERPKYLLCTELPGTEKFEELAQKYMKAS